jgi:cholera toxin transcriptional activator
MILTVQPAAIIELPDSSQIFNTDAYRKLDSIKWTPVMPPGVSAPRYRFGDFEADSATGELRRRGLRVKLHAQPFQILLLLLVRRGEMLTREEICRELWPEGTFVDYEHGVNSAVNRLREALGDRAGNPRFVETLARRGYRFVAPVEVIQANIPTDEPASPAVIVDRLALSQRFFGRALAASEDLPKSSHFTVQILFVLLQIMYLGFYVGALTNLPETGEFFSSVPFATEAFGTVVATAALLIPVRTFLLCAVLFHAPRMRAKFLKIWPVLLLLDGLWALAPFLLHRINYGLALACTTLLVYSPFAQRSLILMGAGSTPPPEPVLTAISENSKDPAYSPHSTR